MPITFTPASPAGVVSPGLPIQLQSDFIGPLPSGSFWTVDFYATETSELPFFHVLFFTQSNIIGTTPFVPESDKIQQTPTQDWPVDGSSIKIVGTLSDGNHIQDEDSTTITWSDTAGLGKQAYVNALQGRGTGLTEGQANQLAAVDTRTQAVLGDDPPVITTPDGAETFTIPALLSGKTLDMLTTTEVSSGPGPGPFASSLENWFFGVIVRVTSLPEWLTPATPAQDWYYPDLAVLRVFRGTDVEERYGIHTVSFMHPFHGLYAGVLLNETLLFPNPPDSSIEVEFLDGVEGQVFLLRFP